MRVLLTHEAGAVSVLTAAILAFCVLAALVLAGTGAAMSGSERAVTAAESAALAAAPVTFRPFGGSGPVDEAARYAAANGARLVACRCPVDRSWRPRTVTVTVELTLALPVIGGATFRRHAAAEFVPVELLR